jgi:hypothetical protein
MVVRALVTLMSRTPTAETVASPVVSRHRRAAFALCLDVIFSHTVLSLVGIGLIYARMGRPDCS